MNSMTQETIAVSYQQAIRIVRKARQKALDLKPVRDILTNVIKYLNDQATIELAETLEAPTETVSQPAMLPFLLFDKTSGKAEGSFATLDAAKEAGKHLEFWEVWSDGTRMIVISNGYAKYHAARG